MLIAQLTDLHLGFEQGNPVELNRQRLDQAIEALLTLDPAPDLLILSGDLTDAGSEESYRQLRGALAACAFPVFPCVGNHDLRRNLISCFPEIRAVDGFIQYTVEDWPLRLVVLDTVEEGRHGGAFCERRAQWLEDRLNEAPQRPTLLAFHHPPIDTGIEWMTSNPKAAWARRLTDVVSAHSNVIAGVCGHVHRAMATSWAGTRLIVCSSSAPQVALDLKPMRLNERPDNRPMIVAEPPSYALHIWRGEGVLISHFGCCGPFDVLARSNERMQVVARRFIRENDLAPTNDS